MRDELNRLKTCQITFLTVPITSTGLILAFGLRAHDTTLLKYLTLFPITIILPSLLIFFDKATSITRITGYYRLLEEYLLEKNYRKYIGWECSLREYRKRYHGLKLSEPVREETSIVRHKFWLYSFFIYNILCLICFILSIFFLWKYDKINLISDIYSLKLTIIHHDIFYFAAIVSSASFILFSFCLSLHELTHLMWKKYSYSTQEKNWKRLLDRIYEEKNESQTFSMELLTY